MFKSKECGCEGERCRKIILYYKMIKKTEIGRFQIGKRGRKRGRKKEREGEKRG